MQVEITHKSARASLRMGTALAWALGLVSSAPAAEWPGHFVTDKESRSPNGHYAIVVATSDHVHDGNTLLIEDPSENFVDYFADLKRHRLLGKIKGFEYVDGENHAHMDTLWSEDSKVCVATYWGRYGFSTAAVLEPNGEGFTQADLGPHIQDAANAAVKRTRDNRMEVYPKFVIGPGPAVHVCAPASSNSKSLAGVETDFALFLGAFDLRSKKWVSSSAHAIDAIENDLLQGGTPFDPAAYSVSAEAFKDQPMPQEPAMIDDKYLFRTPESQFAYFDHLLNDIYQAVKTMVPPDQFTAIKTEQIAWLKTRDAAASLADKGQRTAERIAALQKLLP